MHAEFLDLTRSGNELIKNTVRELIYLESEELFNLIDFYDDEIFLEPLLYCYFNYKKSSSWNLEQILWGYVEEAKRPKQITVNSYNGLVYLPNIGYLRTSPYTQPLVLSYERNEEIKLVTQQGVSVEYELVPLYKLAKYNISLITFQNELLTNVFIDESGKKAEVKILENALAFSPMIERVLNVIEVTHPVYFDCFKETVRNFCLYEGSSNSFAAIAAHTTAFFNKKPSDGVIYFLDNIVHQCAHVIFNAITFEKQKWFSVKPDTPLSAFTQNAEDTQDIYGRFHGLFTQTNINHVLDRCIELELFDGAERHELLGRFSSNMKRFRVALDKLNHPGMYTEFGYEWYMYFRTTYQQLFEKRSALILKFDVGNQPYVFDYGIFQQTNPIEL
jgi:hypothetical protein